MLATGHNSWICLEKDKDRYANNRDVMPQQNRDYRHNNVEKERLRRKLDVSNHKEELN